MENILIVCLNSVLPLFLTMAVGFAARLAGIIGERDVSRMNAIAFKVFLPLMLFYNIYSSDISYAVRPKLIGFTVGCVFVIFALCLGYVLLVEKDKTRQGVMIQGLYRSNFVIVGLPVAQALMGDADLSVVAVLIAIVVPIFNILAVITLEVFRGNKVKPWKIFLEVLENPLLIGSVVGILFVIFKIQLPGPVKTVVGNLAGIASPLMLFLLGAFFRFENMHGHVKELVQVCVGRLVIIPGVFLWISYLVGFKGVEFAALMSIFASSTSVSSFTMAQQMGGDAKLAGDIVVITSVFCSFSFYLWSIIYKLLGVI